MSVDGQWMASGCHWMSVDGQGMVSGCQWMSVDGQWMSVDGQWMVSGCQWMVRGCQWMSVDDQWMVSGCRWMISGWSVDVVGCQWMVTGCQWRPVDVTGCQWMPVDDQWMASGSSCNVIAQVTDVLIDLSTYNTSHGTVVTVGCKRFGHRVIGPQNVTCLNTSVWSDTTQPKCAWTGELNTYEKLVIGVAASCIILLLICLVLIISLVIYRHSRRQHSEKDSDSDSGRFPPYAINHHVEHAYYPPPMVHRGSGPYKHRISRPAPYQRGDKSKYRNTDYDNQYNYQNERNGYIQNGTPSDYTRGNYHNHAYDGGHPEHRYPVEVTTNPSDQDAYKWNGHIPRPKLGPEGREPF
ncbi:uncharacterized protein LOC132562996 [Ylistrum balloti]|uniref:uncharacterized protein LOC132562996 n=1 Tax=Ylistrum balloti TaxID=509963 RepID=UPI002905D85A|nr:uncharacterized protein LOC132562996 [Ylistrum balloti]